MNSSAWIFHHTKTQNEKKRTWDSLSVAKWSIRSMYVHITIPGNIKVLKVLENVLALQFTHWRPVCTPYILCKLNDLSVGLPYAMMMSKLLTNYHCETETESEIFNGFSNISYWEHVAKSMNKESSIAQFKNLLHRRRQRLVSLHAIVSSEGDTASRIGCVRCARCARKSCYIAIQCYAGTSRNFPPGWNIRAECWGVST